ncbi:MAG: PAS domain S-box protein [Terasakiella sp.]|uniref:PAS domain S-box protein n=1 Tax=unclassified Terasakiella TaxID=2614952 RepID=UPI003B00E766
MEQQSDRNIRSVMERGPAVMYHCAQYWDYGVDYITPNIKELLGWDAAEFSRNPMFRLEVIHPDDLQRILPKIPELFESGRQKHEYRMRKKDGTYLWVLDDMRVLANEAGEYDGLVGYLTDITDLKAAEQSLRKSELRHRAIFETVLEGIITIDSGGIVKDMNPAAEKMFGYSKDMVVGQNVSILMPEPYASNHDGYLARYLKTGETHIMGAGRTVMGKRADGQTFEMNLSVSLLKLPEGTFFVGAVRDVSKRIRAERDLRISQERLKMSQKFAKMGTWDWHIDEDRLFWSEQMFQLYGVKDDGSEERRERFEDWVLDEDLHIIRDAIRKCLRDASEMKCEYRVRLPSGDIRWVREQGNVVRDENEHATRMLGVTQDISAEKHYAEILNAARVAADTANEAKSEFLSRMSHELRTPLNAILGFAQLLGMSTKHPLGDRQKRQVNQIVSAGHHLMDLINEILDLARIEAGHLHLTIEAVDVQGVLDDCLELSENTAQEHDVSFNVHYSGDLAVKVDRTRCKQVLLNLLSNAIKYNRPGNFVDVSIFEVDDERVEFRISDHGNGIPIERQSHLFKPFDRLGAEMTGIEGTGIGLTLTKQLVEAMGGIIGFDSVVGEGTTFWVQLPISKQGKNHE